MEGMRHRGLASIYLGAFFVIGVLAIDAGQDKKPPSDTRENFEATPNPSVPNVEKIKRKKDREGDVVTFVYPSDTPRGPVGPPAEDVLMAGEAPGPFTIDDCKDITVEIFCGDADALIYISQFSKGAQGEPGTLVNITGGEFLVLVQNCPNTKFLQIITKDEITLEIKDKPARTFKMDPAPLVDGNNTHPIGGNLAVAEGVSAEWDVAAWINQSQQTGYQFGTPPNVVAIDGETVTKLTEITEFKKYIYCDCGKKKEQREMLVGMVSWTVKVEITPGATAAATTGDATVTCSFKKVSDMTEAEKNLASQAQTNGTFEGLGSFVEVEP